MTELVDSHCHLDEERFDGDRAEVIARAKAAGVTRMITIGASGSMKANYDAVALSEQDSAIYATVGIHPHDAKTLTDAVFKEIGELARKPRVVAVGETGLDYYYDNSPRQQQQEAFRLHVCLARKLGLPVVVHLRDAYDDAVDILRDERAQEIGGVIHCFSGDRNDARNFLDLGFDLSFSGIVTFKTAGELRAVAAMIPADRYLVETDAPFLAPVPYRGKRNEPAFVVQTAKLIAEVRQEEFEVVARRASENAARRFRLPISGQAG
jgi:TatD DNase family protein